MFTLGIVPYLNALPLYRTLELSGAVRFVRAVPAQLTSHLTAGECDVALIPIVDYFRGAGPQIVSDACIASSGAVRSVLLFSNVPVQEIKSVAADTSSHTSVALLRVILADGYKVHPPFVEHEPDLRSMLAAHDAALLIGDKALEQAVLAKRAGINIFDLGAAWSLAVAKKPFVYAAWVARPGLEPAASAELNELLCAARDEGVLRLSAILRDNPIKTTLPREEIEDYLRHAIEYRLTPQHRAGMEEFRRRCERHGLV
ncbi:MAG TPA: menaquinone biosynthesis protein [Abditibacteriaceae bacterium]|nr:menaquinone biosynthesis protein [Abditibacteriaceae bacterium]